MFNVSCEVKFVNLNKLLGGVIMIVVYFGNIYEWFCYCVWLRKIILIYGRV